MKWLSEPFPPACEQELKLGSAYTRACNNHQTMTTCWGEEIELHAVLTSTPDEGEFSASSVFSG